MFVARQESRDDSPLLINEKALRGISNLPVLPVVWQKLLASLEDPWVSLGQLEALIRQEQGLSVRVLSQANSSYYGLSGRVTNVQMAMQVLGLQEVRRICMSSGVEQLLRTSRLYKHTEGQLLWRHCLAVAEAGAILAQALARPDGETAFAAGLLHDLGKVLLAACFALAYQSVRQLQQREGMSWLEAEARQNLDHQFMGRFLAQRWGLPPLLIEVIGQHHRPQGQLEHGEMVALVHLADGLVLSLDEPEPDLQTEDGGRAWKHSLTTLGLDQAALEACRQRLIARLEVLPSI